MSRTSQTVYRQGFVMFDGCESYHLGMRNPRGVWLTACNIICVMHEPDDLMPVEPFGMTCCQVCSRRYAESRSEYRKMLKMELGERYELLSFRKSHTKSNNTPRTNDSRDYIGSGL